MIKYLITISFLIISLKSNCQNRDLVYNNTTFSSIIETEKRENRYILYYLHTSWCGICKQVDIDVLNNQKVIEYINRGYIFKKINGESEEGKQIVKKYGVRAYPTFLLLSPKGELIGAIEGCDYPEKFIKNLEAIRLSK